MKIKTNIVDFIGKEIHGVFSQNDNIFVTGKQKITSVIFHKDNKVAFKTDVGGVFLYEDICMDLEQAKARAEELSRSIAIIKPKQQIILPDVKTNRKANAGT